MPRTSRLTPLVAPFAVALLVAGLILPAAGRAQEQPDPAPTVGARQPTQRPKRVAPDAEGLLLFAVVDELPAAPAFVRLLRIDLEPEAISPLHFHPGPEMGLIETGVATVLVEGPADLLPRGRTKPIAAEEGAEFELERGDQILYRAGSPMQFRNAEEEGVTSVLTAVILPAGHQHPPGQTWVDGPPGPNALRGLSYFVLGDGIATGLPQGPASVAIERLILEAGEPIPAYAGPVMLSVESGSLPFETVSGETQVSPAGGDGPQPAAELGAEFGLGPGDGVFFPTGLTEVERPEDSGTLALLRLTIAPAPPLPDAGTPAATPAAEAVAEPAVIEVVAPATPEPEPTEEAAATEEAEATEEPAAPTPGGEIFPVGTVVVVNDVGVNLRAEPTTSAEVVAVLDEGAQLTITGDPVEADDFLWYPVESVDDPDVSGWMAGQFLDPSSG